MRVVAYLRVSTDDQADAGNGLNAQRDACRAWMARERAEAAGEFADAGVSGAAPLERRPALVDALAALGPGGVLLVAKRDRLGRDPWVVGMIEAAARRKGARVVSAAGEGTDDDSPASVLMRRIIDGFAEYERLLIKARTRAALQAKRRRGERTGQVPLGFALADDGRRSKSGGSLALVPDDAEQGVLATIADLARSGLGPRPIARELQRRGIPTKTGRGPWSPEAVRKILLRLPTGDDHERPDRDPGPDPGPASAPADGHPGELQ